MLQIASPFQQIFDTDGSPLDNGYIYIGTANANPETSPIAIYWDDAGTIPAAQPLRTLNGYLVRSGTPARVYTALEDFSMTVKDRQGRVVFSVLDATSLSNLQSSLASSSGSSLVGFLQAGTGAQLRTVQSKLRDVVSVKDFGAVGDGIVDDTLAFTDARTASSGRYYVPDGTYLVASSPDVWADNFTASGAAYIKIGATTYNISNAFAGRLRYQVASNVLTNIVDAVTGNIIVGYQNSAAGTATYFYRGLAFKTDSHWCQVKPATNGGSTDLLWQRSDVNADPNGNRFNETFEEANDRLIFSFATTASGAPAFDSFMVAGAGTSPYLTFPGLRPQFNQGISVKQRAAGGYEFGIEQSSSTQAKFKQIGGSGTTYMLFRDGAFGFFGSSGTSQQTVTGSKGGNAALASLITALANTGLIVDGTT
jgi:hypothetical protein